MKKIWFFRLVCVFIVLLLVVDLPFNNIYASDGEGGMGEYSGVDVTVWREAESWDRSLEKTTDLEWNIIYDLDCSDDYNTKTDILGPVGDYAEWDFTVFTPGEYHFYIRAWCKPLASNNVSLYWNGDFIGNQSFNQNQGQGDYKWYWKDFDTYNLSEGDGVLKIQDNTGALQNMKIDNILITNTDFDPNEELNGGINFKGEEGSYSHFIGFSQPSGEIVGLDYDFIKNVTYNLSQIVKNAYELDELHKGREFGSKGELNASEKIEDWMDDIGLFKLGLSYREQLESIYSKLFRDRLPTMKITNKLNVSYINITIYDKVNNTSTYITEGCIRPMWNWGIIAAVRDAFENLPDFENWLSEVLEFDLTDSYVYDCIFDQSCLTKNVALYNLTLKSRPTDFSWLYDVLFNNKENIQNNESIVNISTLFHFLLPELQEAHRFSFGTVNQSIAEQNFSWYTTEWQQSDRYDPNADFVYIAEDPNFNPNSIELYNNLTKLLELIEEIFPNFDAKKLMGKFLAIESYLFNATMPNFKGILYYDFNNDTYDMNYDYLNSHPMIYINGTKGSIINSNRNVYRVNYTINQNWIEDVESYNVIGQIYGTNPKKTVIVGCLYDSWWNQGTADSAIGIGIMLSIAKWFKENHMVPKYNIKFIAFSGEEYGLRGAYYYEKAHRDEDIIAFIDLNQLGFKQNSTWSNRILNLNVTINNDSIIPDILNITNRSNYEERINDNTVLNVVNFSKKKTSNYIAFYIAIIGNKRPFFNIVSFLKDTNWTLHHRDGNIHDAGDVMEYYYDDDVNVTTEMILNVTRYFAGETIFLRNDINLITIPYENNWYASDLLENLSGCLYVIKWDPDAQDYWIYLPGFPAFDFPLIPGNGYFVEMNNTSVLSFNGSSVTDDDVNVSLELGWNLIGWYNDSSIMASELVENLSGCLYVVKWDPVEQSFWIYVPGFPAFDFVVSKYMGLFVEINESGGYYGEGEQGNGSGPPVLPYPIYGRAFYRNQSNPVDTADVFIINLNTSECLNTSISANYSGCYIADLNELNQSWNSSDIIRIVINGTGNYSGWTGQKDIVLNTTIPGEHVPDIFLNPTNISLQMGWNLVTVPLNNSWNASDLVEIIIGCQSVSRWDAVNQTYRSYVAGGPSEFDFSIDDGIGYYVNVNQTSILSWSDSGSPITNASMSYETGWNLIGWYNDYSINASSLASDINNSDLLEPDQYVVSISKWNASNQTYHTYMVGSPPGSDFDIMKGMGIVVNISNSTGGGSGCNPGTPHTIWGYAYYLDSNIHADNANVIIHNKNTSEQIYTTVGESASGCYMQELGNLPSGWSNGDIIRVTIVSTDEDIYEDWEGIIEISANVSVGNQKTQDIILSGVDCVVIRYDNGSFESTVMLDNSTDEVLKTFIVDSEYLEQASSAKLWIYAKADGEDLENLSHKITVNNESKNSFLFDPIDTFGYSYCWQSFTIELDWLTSGSNTFSVVDAFTGDKENNLIIGVDTENDDDMSQWKESSGVLPPADECEGELTMVLELFF